MESIKRTTQDRLYHGTRLSSRDVKFSMIALQPLHLTEIIEQKADFGNRDYSRYVVTCNIATSGNFERAKITEPNIIQECVNLVFTYQELRELENCMSSSNTVICRKDNHGQLSFEGCRYFKLKPDETVVIKRPAKLSIFNFWKIIGSILEEVRDVIADRRLISKRKSVTLKVQDFRKTKQLKIDELVKEKFALVDEVMRSKEHIDKLKESNRSNVEFLEEEINDLKRKNSDLESKLAVKDEDILRKAEEIKARILHEQSKKE